MRISKIITAFLGMTFLFSIHADSSVFNFTIRDDLADAIKLSPVTDTSDFELIGDAVVQPSNTKVFPKLALQEQKKEVSIGGGSTECIIVSLGEIDFSSIGLSTGSSIVQRLQIVDTKNSSTIGYLSFRCSAYNTNPIVTIESCEGYKISEEDFPFGGGSINIVVKKCH